MPSHMSPISEIYLYFSRLLHFCVLCVGGGQVDCCLGGKKEHGAEIVSVHTSWHTSVHLILAWMMVGNEKLCFY